MNATGTALATRPYACLLHLYPRRFWRQFARDMMLDFGQGLTASHRHGGTAMLAFLLRSYADLAFSLVVEWRRDESFFIWRVAVLSALSIWTAAFAIAALEWRDGPVTAWFAMQLGAALTVCATLTIASALRITKPDRRSVPIHSA
jgi:hypothetical protein